MLTTLLGGHVDAAWANPSECIEQYKAGQVRILAVADTKRIADFPDVPTFKEAGVDMVSYNWRGIGGPPKLPKAVIDYWIDVLGQDARAPTTGRRATSPRSTRRTAGSSAISS